MGKLLRAVISQINCLLFTRINNVESDKINLTADILKNSNRSNINDLSVY